VTGGSAMNDEERHQLLCQLRLMRMLGALPAGTELSPEERACVAAALEPERDLRQQREQANNLEGGRGWAGGGEAAPCWRTSPVLAACQLVFAECAPCEVLDMHRTYT